MSVRPLTAEAYQLMQDGAEALAHVESNGICVDEDYLDRAIRRTEWKIKESEEWLRSDPIYRTWRRRFGQQANLGSREQLATVLFDEMKIPSPGYTSKSEVAEDGEKKRYRTDKAALTEFVDLEFVRQYEEKEQLRKLLSTYLKGLKRETVNGFVHPVINLHLVLTFRSSADSPNIQNQYNRNPKMSAILRKCFVPREDDWVLAEIDFSAVEVRGAACVTGDTKIETIDGSQEISEVIRRVKDGESVYVYGYDFKNKRVGVSEVLEGGITRKNTEVWELELDNGEKINATPDHKFLLRDGQYRSLSELVVGDSLMPFYKKRKRTKSGVSYDKVYLNNGESMMAHNLIALDVMGVTISGSDLVVHHKDSNGVNNSLINLQVMSRRDHMSVHSIQGWSSREGRRGHMEWSCSEENLRQFVGAFKRKWDTLSDMEKDEFRQRVSEGIRRSGANTGELNGMYGKKHKEETRQKISRSKKGKKTGASWNRGLTKDVHPSLAQMSDSLKGMPAWNKGKQTGPLSDEHRTKLSEATKGRDFTDEHKESLSDGMKRRWERQRNSPPDQQCPVCGKLFRALSSHMARKHGTSPSEYKSTHNHKVVSIRYVGHRDVYNITVEGFHNYATTAGVVIKNCYNEDPELIKYIEDSSTDMHRDQASEIFKLSVKYLKEEAGWAKKNVRDWSKNQFVFPEFYGSVFYQCAPPIWQRVCESTDKMPGKDMTVKEYLASVGITELGECDSDKVRDGTQKGTFVHHLKEVENKMWNERFTVYRDWKRSFYGDYLERGYFDHKVGFRQEGIYARNDVTNHPIQGSCFHWLLWCLIRIQKEFWRRKMRALVVSEVHDCILVDAPFSEIQDVLSICKQVMTEDVRKHWSWIIVPLAVEADVTPRKDEGGTWLSKAPWIDVNGVWKPKEK